MGKSGSNFLKEYDAGAGSRVVLEHRICVEATRRVGSTSLLVEPDLLEADKVAYGRLPTLNIRTRDIGVLPEV